MKNQKLLLFVFFTLSILSQGFSQTTFSKVIDISNSVEFGVELVYYEKKYFGIGLGTVVDTIEQTYTFHNYLAILDETRNIENYFTLRRFFKSHSLLIENDTLYLQGTDISEDIFKWNMYKFNIHGDSLDLLVYDNFDLVVEWYETQIKDNYIYSGGDTGENSFGGHDILILKMDKSGAFIKENRFYEYANPKYVNIFGGLTKTADGNFALSSSYDGASYDNQLVHVGVCKFDENLDTIWTKYFHESVSDNAYNEKYTIITASLDSGVVVGTAWSNEYSNVYYNKPHYRDTAGWPLLFCKLDKNGNVEWTDTIFESIEPGKGSGPSKVILKMITAKNGDIISVGEYNSKYDKPLKQGWACRYSPEGKLKWQHNYVDIEYTAESSLFFDVKEAENGDIIYFGGVKTDSLGEWYNKGYSWLLRVDSNGCYTPGCILADTLTEVLTDIEDLTRDGLPKRIEIYPNPASSDITVSLPEGIMWKQWRIYNFAGQKVMNGDIDMKSQTSNISGLEELQSGIYFVLITDNKGKRGVGKFVVE